MRRMIVGGVWFAVVSVIILVVLTAVLRADILTDYLIEYVGDIMDKRSAAGQEDDAQEEQSAAQPAAREREYISPEKYEPENISDVIINDAGYYHAGELELPVSGATGYAAVDLDLKIGTEVIASIKAGTAFLIMLEDNIWWYVSADTPDGKKEGWAEHKYCLINLPDVIPSIIYDNKNSYSSAFASSGQIIPGITGQRLYRYSERADGKLYNERLKKNEYIVPVLYETAKKLGLAQRSALDAGDTLILYEAYRPHLAQASVANGLTVLANANPRVQANLNAGGWDMAAFASPDISSHQAGYAIDASLARVLNIAQAETGGYKYRQIVKAEYYDMPTPVHELSILAADQIDPHVQTLRAYCTEAGFTPLESKWWHFDDLYTRASLARSGTGNFEIKEAVSAPPRN